MIRSGQFRLLMLLALLMLPILALDLVASAEISPWALYALPVVVAAWLGGRREGLAATAAVVALLGLAALLKAHSFDSAWGLASALLNRSVALGLVALLVAHARGVDLYQSIAQSRETEA